MSLGPPVANDLWCEDKGHYNVCGAIIICDNLIVTMELWTAPDPFQEYGG